MIRYPFLRRTTLFAVLLVVSHLSFAQTTYWKTTRVKAGDNFFGELLKYMFADLRLSLNESQQQLVLYYPSEDTLVIKNNKVILNEDTTTLVKKNNILTLYSKHRRDTVSITLQEVKDTMLFFKGVRAIVDRDQRRLDSFYVKHGVFKRSDFPGTAARTQLWSLGKQLVIALPQGYLLKQSSSITDDVYLDSATIRYQYQLLKEQGGSLESLGDFYVFEDKNAFTNWKKFIGSLEDKSVAWKEDSGFIRMSTTFNLDSHTTKLDSYKVGRFFTSPASHLSCYFYSGNTSTRQEVLKVYSIASGLRVQSSDAKAYASLSEYVAGMMQPTGPLPGNTVQNGNCSFYLPFHLKYSEFGVGSTGFYEWNPDQLQISSDSAYCRKFSFDKLVPSEDYYHSSTIYAVVRPQQQFSFAGFIKSNLSEGDDVYYQDTHGIIFRSSGHYAVLLHRYDTKAGQHYLFHADRVGSLEGATKLFMMGQHILEQKTSIVKPENPAQYAQFLNQEEQQNIDSVIRLMKKSFKENDSKENLWYTQANTKFIGSDGFNKITLAAIQPGIIDAIAASTKQSGKFALKEFFHEKYGVADRGGSGLKKDSIVYQSKNLLILKGNYESSDNTTPFYNLYYYTGYNKLSSLIYLDEEQFSLPYTYFLASLLQQAFGNQ